MARTDFPCLVDGCSSPVHARGHCNTHYRRLLKFGDPVAGPAFLTKHGEPLDFFKNIVLPYEADACLLWPYAKRDYGHGVIYYEKRMRQVHRVLCMIRHGPPPTSRYHAAHNCGVASCVNYRHIRWATAKENAADKLIHGTDAQGEKHPLATLTDDQAKEILLLEGTASQAQIAKMFNVGFRTINNIYRGKTWKHLPRHKASEGGVDQPG